MKKGFTLAEVLITLGIIGVVSALTVPALMTNVQKNGIGASLSKAYNTLSNATEMIISTQGVSTISEAVRSEELDDFLTEFKKYAKASSVNDDFVPLYKFYNNNGADVGSDYSNETTTVQTPDGIWFYFSNTLGDSGAAPEPYVGRSRQVFVDINGAAGPNIWGRDFFEFLIDDNGTVLPYGGSAFGEYIGREDPLYMEAGNSCYVDEDGKAHVGSGEYCAGFIADNGWKVTY